jgi:hypothetical protein
MYFSFSHFLKTLRSVKIAVLLALGVLGFTGGGYAQSTVATVVSFDASHAFVEPSAARYDWHSSVASNGSAVGLNSRYLTCDGKPWLPVMGDFHFSRYPRAQREEELLKMKASGVNIVAAYILWTHHEEVERQFCAVLDVEHFSNMRAVLSGVQGGFFLRKKPLGILLSLYTNWKNALGCFGLQQTWRREL